MFMFSSVEVQYPLHHHHRHLKYNVPEMFSFSLVVFLCRRSFYGAVISILFAINFLVF